MIFTAEEYMELAEAMLPSSPSRSNTVGAKNHIEDHNAIAKVIWGPSGGSKITMIKVTKNADSINVGGTAVGSDGEDVPLDSEDLEDMMEAYKSFAEFYDVIVSQEGLLDLHYTEWPVGAWFELFMDGLMASSLKVDSFIRDSYGSQDDDIIRTLNLGAIWKFLTFSCDIQRHTYASGAWSPALPEMTDDMSMFDFRGSFFRPGPGATYREGQVMYSVRPKYLDTIKDLTASLSTLESDSATLNTTVSDLEADVSTLTADKETLEGKVSTLESDNSTLNATVSTLESDNDSLNETVSGLETDLGSLSSANDTLSSTVSTLEGNVATLTSDKEALEGQVSTLESTIADLTSRLEALEAPTTPE